MYGFRMAIEAFGIDRFKNNSIKAAEGFNFILRILYPNQSLRLTTPMMESSIVPSFDETREKFKEKAKQARKIAAEKISLVSNANCHSKNNNNNDS